MTRCRRQKQLPKLEYEFLPEHALRTDAHLQRYAEQIRTRGLSHRGGTRNHLNQSGMFKGLALLDQFGQQCRLGPPQGLTQLWQ